MTGQGSNPGGETGGGTSATPSSTTSGGAMRASVGPSPGPSPGNRWGARAALAFVLLLIVGPILYKQFPREVARWHHAAAIEHYLNDDLTRARQSLEAARSWNPDNGELDLQQASWECERGSYEEALASCVRAEERGVEPTRLLFERSQVYQHLGRWQEALQDWKQLAALVEGADFQPVLLNGLAYARALANVELEEGLRDIERALQQAGKNPAMLDTRGYLYFRLGKLEEALRDMDESIAGQEAEIKQASNGRSQADRAAEDGRVTKRLELARRRSLAVLRYHRLLVVEQQGKMDEAEAERSRIRELGFEPGPQLF